MEVAEKEDRERERETEIANLKEYIKSLKNELATAKTSAQIPRSEVPATSKSEVPAISKSEVPAPSESQPSTSTSTELQRRVSSSNFTLQEGLPNPNPKIFLIRILINF